MQAVAQNSPDWTTFDIRKCLQVLCSGPNHARKRKLRKLLLRWWHASVHRLNSTLSAAGVPTEVLSMIGDIVATCRQCREGAKPASDTKATFDVPQAINETVECDIMFFMSHMIFHLIDRASRFHHGSQVTSMCVCVCVVCVCVCVCA